MSRNGPESIVSEGSIHGLSLTYDRRVERYWKKKEQLKLHLTLLLVYLMKVQKSDERIYQGGFSFREGQRCSVLMYVATSLVSELCVHLFQNARKLKRSS